MISQPALERPASVVVLHAEAAEVHQLPGIVLGDKLDLDHPVWGNEDLAQLVRQTQDVGGLVEVVVAFLEHVSSLVVPLGCESGAAKVGHDAADREDVVVRFQNLDLTLALERCHVR